MADIAAAKILNDVLYYRDLLPNFGYDLAANIGWGTIGSSIITAGALIQTEMNRYNEYKNREDLRREINEMRQAGLYNNQYKNEVQWFNEYKQWKEQVQQQLEEQIKQLPQPMADKQPQMPIDKNIIQEDPLIPIFNPDPLPLEPTQVIEQGQNDDPQPEIDPEIIPDMTQPNGDPLVIDDFDLEIDREIEIQQQGDDLDDSFEIEEGNADDEQYVGVQEAENLPPQQAQDGLPAAPLRRDPIWPQPGGNENNNPPQEPDRGLGWEIPNIPRIPIIPWPFGKKEKDTEIKGDDTYIPEPEKDFQPNDNEGGDLQFDYHEIISSFA